MDFHTPRERLLLPFLAPFYDRLAQPLAWVGFRVLVGVLLVQEGLPKLMAPFAQVGFVERLGFHPGWLWSPMLAVMQVFGGAMIAAGLLTRPMAFANAVMLAVTLWFHVTRPYGEVFLTEAGLALLGSQGAEIFTPAALRRLADGGTSFLHQVQGKAEMLSILWTGAAAFFAAFGGGPYSLDRLLRKEV